MGLNLIPWVIAGLVSLGALGYITHCEYVKKDRANFISSLEQQAADQKKRNDERTKQDIQDKEQADAAREKERNNFHATINRLRNERTHSSSVPPTTTTSSRPDLSCFDRAEFVTAVGNLEAGMEAIAGKGAEATIDLNSGKSWALKLSKGLGKD